MVGYLSKIEDTPYPGEPFPAIPLMGMKSPKSYNRWFYYVVDQRAKGDIPVKIMFNHVRINDRVYTNADEYGVEEMFDGDTVQDLTNYPNIKFRANIYRTPIYP
jgi:hypothetical protein